jgi:hypothetical protein
MPKSKKVDIDRFVAALTEAYRDWRAPVITFIANRGATPFEILVSTLLSLRTKDEVTAVAAKRLFAEARTPDALLALGEQNVAGLIYPVGFYPTKAKRLMQISQILLTQYQKGAGLHGGAAGIARGRTQDGQSRSGGRFRTAGHVCGHSRPPHQQPDRLCSDPNARANRDGAATQTAASPLDPVQ